MIPVRDREGDFRDMPDRAVTGGDALPVRAGRPAQERVRIPDGEECPWAHVAACRPVAMTGPTIPAAGGTRARKERIARLGIRMTGVEPVPPHRQRGAGTMPVPAVPATGTGADGEPAGRLLPTTCRPAEGEADAMHAGTVLDRYRRRRTIETRSGTLKSGTRIRDRRLDHAGDPGKCLAFDAITAMHVADLTVMARERPGTPAGEMFPEEDIELLHTMPESRGHRHAGRMTAGRLPDIRAVVIDPGRLVGSRPVTRRQLPGAGKAWQGLERLDRAIRTRDAIGARRRE